MSHIDAQLEALRRNLAALEEQKRIEAEKEMEEKKNPLKIVERVLDEKRKMFETQHSHGYPNVFRYCMECDPERVHICVHRENNEHGQNILRLIPKNLKPEKDMINILEPIINVLKNIQDRLEALEKRE